MEHVQESRTLIKFNDHSFSDVYVTNLAIADFIFVSTIPFWAVDLIESEWR